MSTFLQLARNVKRESGLTSSGPADYATATGDDARLFAWVNWAARDIMQERKDWKWRRGTATVASTLLATLTNSTFNLTDWSSWRAQNRFWWPTCYRVADGVATERKLTWLDYDKFRQQFRTGTQTPGVPQCWSVSPAGEFLLGPAPDSAVCVNTDYIKKFIPMAANTDTPQMPEDWHDLITWRALTEYGGFDAAGEVYQRASQNYERLWASMAQDQLDAPGFAHRALA